MSYMIKLFIIGVISLVGCADVTGVRFVNNPVYVGDNVKEVVAKWGVPNDTSKTETAEAWYAVMVYKCMRMVYPRYYFLPCYYIYLTDGIVTAVERVY
jgi:hypothetical protein